MNNTTETQNPTDQIDSDANVDLELVVRRDDHFASQDFTVNEKHNKQSDCNDKAWYLPVEDGCITIVDRQTGFTYPGTFQFRRDTETGFRDKDDNFWLASGDFDIRREVVIMEQSSKAESAQN